MKISGIILRRCKGDIDDNGKELPSGNEGSYSYIVLYYSHSLPKAAT